ncbi:MAG: hypothetical protein U0792_17205 [Gemmataceae bacterium]
MQVFYPDFFNGCWSQCPIPVTFGQFRLINLYKEENAYVNRYGVDRPGTRTLDGDTVSSVRHECQLERVLRRGGQWELSGRDWASWNAVYGPKGKDGLPVPVWDGKTGAINKDVRTGALEEARPEAGGKRLEATDRNSPAGRSTSGWAIPTITS